MALLNESVAESVHADFDRHYHGYIVKDINSPKYAERLSHAVKTYNLSHVQGDSTSKYIFLIMKHLNVDIHKNYDQC